MKFNVVMYLRPAEIRISVPIVHSELCTGTMMLVTSNGIMGLTKAHKVQNLIVRLLLQAGVPAEFSSFKESWAPCIFSSTVIT